MKHVLRILLFTVFGACRSVAPTPPMLTLQTDLLFYRPGEFVSVKLTNLGSDPLSYDVCKIQLQQFESGWRTVAPETTLCALPITGVGPGEARTITVALGGALQTGVYRVVLGSVTDKGSLLPEDQRTSNPFRIS